jgi:hypothetical protein
VGDRMRQAVATVLGFFASLFANAIAAESACPSTDLCRDVPPKGNLKHEKGCALRSAALILCRVVWMSFAKISRNAKLQVDSVNFWRRYPAVTAVRPLRLLRLRRHDLWGPRLYLKRITHTVPEYTSSAQPTNSIRSSVVLTYR